MGWVSFYREEFLRGLLGIPAGIRPVAWLCVGPISHLEATPDLERAGWRRRRPLASAIHRGRWGSSAGQAAIGAVADFVEARRPGVDGGADEVPSPALT